MVAFDCITVDAGVMLMLLDVMYLACQMLIWYHYYCQKIMYFYFFICADTAAFYCVYVCVCMRAPARCCRNDGTQGNLTMSTTACLNS